MKSTKNIIIISGITGAIGSALLADYSQDQDVVIYGISRRGQPIEAFLKEGCLPQRTLICSLPEVNGYEAMFSRMDFSNVKSVTYIHAVGLYPFEVSKEGKVQVENDRDGDGINDAVTKLTYQNFVAATTALLNAWKGKTSCAIFAGIADKYKPVVHQSWWKTIEKVKTYMQNLCAERTNLSTVVFNISSVICPSEVITRPFVFTDTDANPMFWLPPHELSQFVVSELGKIGMGYFEVEKFRVKPDFESENYYADQNFTPRKVNELFG